MTRLALRSGIAATPALPRCGPDLSLLGRDAKRYCLFSRNHSRATLDADGVGPEGAPTEDSIAALEVTEFGATLGKLVNTSGRYSFSFITGALFVAESTAIVPLLAQGKTWPEIETVAAQDNLLKSRTAASRLRLLREIKYRLSVLTEAEVDFLIGAGNQDLRALLFIGICRHFSFIRQFVVTVLRPKALALDFQIMPSDFTGFLHRESREHPEIEALTDKSTAKIRQVLCRMLAEASLVDSTSSLLLTPSIPSRALAKVVAKSDANQLRWLLVADADIRHLTH